MHLTVAFHDMPNSISDSTYSLPITFSEVPSLFSPFQGLNVELVCHEYSEELMAFNDCYDISSPNFKEIICLFQQHEFHDSGRNRSHSKSYCWSVLK